MATTRAPDDAPAKASGLGRRALDTPNAVWSLSLVIVAGLFFYFYDSVLPNLEDSIAQGVNDWAQITNINLCLIYAIMALGLNIVVGYAGLLDLGYVAFWAIGSYVGAWLMSSFWYQIKDGFHFGSGSSVSDQAGVHINFWIVLVIGAVVCAIMGILIGAPTLRLRGDYLALVTLGFGEIIPEFFRNGDDIGGHNFTNGTRGINPTDSVDVGILRYVGFPKGELGTQATLPFVFLIFCALLALCVFISLRIRSGRLGRSWLAIREDELAANMMGVPLVKTKLSAYAVGALFGGLGGVAYTVHVGGALPDSFNYNASIFVLIMVVLGGMGNVWGVLVGAIVLEWVNNTGLQQIGSVYNDSFGTSIQFTDYNYLIFGLLLVLMMLFRREGFLPERRTQQIMREPARTELESVGADVEAGQLDATSVDGTAAVGGAVDGDGVAADATATKELR